MHQVYVVTIRANTKQADFDRMGIRPLEIPRPSDLDRKPRPASPSSGAVLRGAALLKGALR